VREAIAHLQGRFPDPRADPVAATTPPSAWNLVNDGSEALLGGVPTTTLEKGIDQLLAALRDSPKH
jgi:hypothetical protein